MQYEDLDDNLLVVCWSFVPNYRILPSISKRHLQLFGSIRPKNKLSSGARLFWERRTRRHVFRARPLIPKHFIYPVPDLEILQISDFEFRFPYLENGKRITCIRFTWTELGVRVYACSCRYSECKGMCYDSNSLSEQKEYISETNVIKIMAQLVA